MDVDVDTDSAALSSHQATARNFVKFYPKWVRNNFQSKKEGKEVGEYRDFVMIICPGQPKSELHREVQDKDKREYPNEWLAYKEGREQRITGTPVELLPGLDTGRADSLKAIYVYTIEQLAEATEPAKHMIGMGANDLVQKAKAYLAKNTAEVQSLKQALAEKDALIAEQGRQLQDLASRITALESAPRKRGKQPSPVPPQ